MTQLESHYESLKVAHDAPFEVIRAAYRSLSQKYHPDKNAGDPAAAQVMSRLNAAYSVLSDEEQRRAYDLQMRHVRAAAGARHVPAREASVQVEKSVRQRVSNYAASIDGRLAILGCGGIAAVLSAVLLFVWQENRQMEVLNGLASHTHGAVVQEAERPGAPPGRNEARATGIEAKPAPDPAPSRAVAEAPAPAAAPPVPPAVPEASDYERLTAMLKKMGLGVHKLDQAAPVPAAPRPALPAQPAGPAKPAVATTAGVRREAERPAAAERARADAPPPEQGSAPATGSSPAANAANATNAANAANATNASPAPRQAVIAKARACASPEYPKSAYRNGETGTVELALLVAADGRVAESKVQHSSGSAVLDKAALKALSQCTFEVTGSGKGAEPVWTTLTYAFSLD